jgi:hypothetical protein
MAPGSIKRGHLPDIPFVERQPISEAQAKRIKGLIAGLANMDQPEVGLSTTLSGGGFAPVNGQTHTDVMVLADHGLQSSAAFTQLVTLGADALPFLLDSLDDQSSTKITVKREHIIDVVQHATELPTNPGNPTEAGIGRRQWEKGESVESYTVKVGDVCFVIIGQIVGRQYQAVRYQPTGFSG